MKFAIPATPADRMVCARWKRSAAAVDEQHRRAAIEARRAFGTGGIRNCWRSELGSQSGRKNQPACIDTIDTLLKTYATNVRAMTVTRKI